MRVGSGSVWHKMFLVSLVATLLQQSSACAALTLAWGPRDDIYGTKNNPGRVKLVPDGSRLVCFTNNDNSMARVGELNTSDGTAVSGWPKMASIPGIGAHNGWGDGGGNIYVTTAMNGYVVKYDAALNKIWQSPAVAPGFEYCEDMLTDSAGDVYASGFDGSSSGTGSTIAKFRGTDGTLLWKHTDVFTGGKDAYTGGMAILPNGNIMRVGADNASNPGPTTPGRVIVHSPLDGSVIKNFTVPYAPTGLAADGNNVIVSSFVSASSETQIQEYDPATGNSLWAQPLVLPNSVTTSLGNHDELMKLSNGSFLVAYEQLTGGRNMPALACFSSGGQLLWNDVVGTTAVMGGWEIAGGIDARNGVAYLPLHNNSSPGTARYVAVNVPEPSTVALLAVGAIGLVASLWRRQRQLA